MKSLLFMLALAASLSGIGSASAQIYPSRAITIVAPFPAGGPSDVLARILAHAPESLVPAITELPGALAGASCWGHDR